MNDEEKMREWFKFRKPPRKFLWMTFCKHVWKEWWETIGEGVQVQQFRCARCLKDKR